MLEPPPRMRLRVEHVGRRRRRRRATRSRNPVDPRGRRAQLQLQAVLKSRKAEKLKGGRWQRLQTRSRLWYQFAMDLNPESPNVLKNPTLGPDPGPAS